jgi:hypothetical protein
VNNPKGRPLAVCIFLIAVWAGARIGLTRNDDATMPAIKAIDFPKLYARTDAEKLHLAADAPSSKDQKNYSEVSRSFFTKQTAASVLRPVRDPQPASSVPTIAASRSDIPAANTSIEPLLLPAHRAQPSIRTSALLATPALPKSSFRPDPEKRLNFYAYSFWRPQTSGGSDAPAALYGGSQSGIIASYALNRTSQSELALLVRAAVTPGQFGEQEIASGLRWRPSRRVPIAIAAERRFRTRSKSNFAIYASTSVDRLSLSSGFDAHGYAQGGLIPGKSPNVFYDAGMRVERKFFDVSGTELAAGLGTWAGGQSGVSRLDAGPTISSKLVLGKSRITISADWRVRIGGDAKPGNGPALTISSGF